MVDRIELSGYLKDIFLEFGSLGFLVSKIYTIVTDDSLHLEQQGFAITYHYQTANTAKAQQNVSAIISTLISGQKLEIHLRKKAISSVI